jgi:hypothetical protein
MIPSVLLVSLSAWAEVDVQDPQDCLIPEAVESAVSSVLLRHAQGNEVDLLLSVATVPGGRGTIANLRAVSGEGEIVLERSFDLAPEDCASAPALFATVLDRFLDELPLERWTLSGPRDPIILLEPVQEDDPVRVEVRLGATMGAAVGPRPHCASPRWGRTERGRSPWAECTGGPSHRRWETGSSRLEMACWRWLTAPRDPFGWSSRPAWG